MKNGLSLVVSLWVWQKKSAEQCGTNQKKKRKRERERENVFDVPISPLPIFLSLKSRGTRVEWKET